MRRTDQSPPSGRPLDLGAVAALHPASHAETLVPPHLYRHSGPSGPVRWLLPPHSHSPSVRHSQRQNGLGFPKVPESALRSRGKPCPAPLESMPNGHIRTTLLCANAIDRIHSLGCVYRQFGRAVRSATLRHPSFHHDTTVPPHPSRWFGAVEHPLCLVRSVRSRWTRFARPLPHTRCARLLPGQPLLH